MQKINKYSELIVESVKSRDEEYNQLIRFGVDINIVDSQGNTALHRAIQDRKLDLVKILVDAGADVNAENNLKRTPIHYLFDTNLFNSNNINFSIFEFLIVEGKADVNIPFNDSGHCILHGLALTGYYDAIILLLNYGANINIQTGDGKTPLYYAYYPFNDSNSDLAIIELLERHGGKADLNLPFNEKGQSLLHIAVQKNNDLAVSALLDQNINVDTMDNEGNTPLHYAISTGSKVVHLLLEKNASIHKQNKQGTTPLSQAIKESKKEIVKLLLEAKDALSIKSKEYYDLVSLAIQQDSIDIFKILIKKMSGKEYYDDVLNHHQQKNDLLFLSFAVKNLDLALAKDFVEKTKIDLTKINLEKDLPLTRQQCKTKQAQEILAFLKTKQQAQKKEKPQRLASQTSNKTKYKIQKEAKINKQGDSTKQESKVSVSALIAEAPEEAETPLISKRHHAKKTNPQTPINSKNTTGIGSTPENNKTFVNQESELLTDESCEFMKKLIEALKACPNQALTTKHPQTATVFQKNNNKFNFKQVKRYLDNTWRNANQTEGAMSAYLPKEASIAK